MTGVHTGRGLRADVIIEIDLHYRSITEIDLTQKLYHFLKSKYVSINRTVC